MLGGIRNKWIVKTIRIARGFTNYNEPGYNPLTQKKIDNDKELMNTHKAASPMDDKSVPPPGRLSIDVIPSISSAHMDRMREDISSMQDIQEYEDLIQSYRRDMDILNKTNAFSLYLNTRKELSLLRDEGERKEKILFATESTYGSLLFGVCLLIILFSLDDLDRKIEKYPKIGKFLILQWWYGQHPIIDKGDRAIRLVEWYLSLDRSIHFNNIAVYNDILGIIGRCSTREAFLSLLPSLAYTLERMYDRYSLYKEQIDITQFTLHANRLLYLLSQYSPDAMVTVISPDSLDTADRPEVLPIQSHANNKEKDTPRVDIPISDALLELIRACFQYSNNSTESSSPTFSDKIRFIEGYCLHRRPLYLNRYFQGVVDELRHDLETREARLMMQRYDGTYIHEGIESFLLRHLK